MGELKSLSLLLLEVELMETRNFLFHQFVFSCRRSLLLLEVELMETAMCKPYNIILLLVASIIRSGINGNHQKVFGLLTSFGSLLLLEVELMETLIKGSAWRVESFNTVASIIRSGINGNRQMMGEVVVVEVVVASIIKSGINGNLHLVLTVP